MAKTTIHDLRNFALLGHGDAGKTTLAEALLFKFGIINRQGRVLDGNTVSDFDEEEKKRQFSIDSSVLTFATQGKLINLIDCPGYPDYIQHSISAVNAVESALIFVHAFNGVAVNTRRTWQLAGDAGVARALVVNKIDLDNINLEELLANLRENFGEHCLPFNYPLGTGPACAGVASLLPVPADLPARFKESFPALANQLKEKIVEADDALLEKYLEGGTVSPEELGGALKKALASGSLCPILFLSADKGWGVDALIDFICQHLPSPAEVASRSGKKPGTEDAKQLPATPEAPFSAQIFKVVTDPFVGRMLFLRVHSGTLPANTLVHSPQQSKPCKIGNLLTVLGKEVKNVESASAGEIVALSKVDLLVLGDTIGSEKEPIVYPAFKFPLPMVAVAAVPRSREDEQRISTSLAKLAEQDPTFVVSRDAQTGELIITGMSNLHLDIMLARLKSRFDVGVDTKPPKIPYKETITTKGEGNYRHKKQTGGRGQFAEAWLRIEPMERGAGFEFVDGVVGGTIPSQFIPAVEKGVREALTKGIVAGYPVVDVRVEIYFGKAHDVDSSEAAFKIAGAQAFKLAMAAAKPVLLEPIANMEVTIPSRFMGDITGDINSRRGRIQGLDSVGTYQVVKTSIPLAEIISYSTELRSITGGEGSYTVEFSHLDPVPARLAETLIQRIKVQQDEEKEK